MDDTKLVAFFYLLMRDKLPTGDVIEVVEAVINLSHERGVEIYTAKHLESYAREIVNRLTSWDSEESPGFSPCDLNLDPPPIQGKG